MSGGAKGEGQAVALRRWAVKTTVSVTIMIAVLFIAAGTLRWPLAWAFAAVMVAFQVLNAAILVPRDPDLLVERSRAQEGTKRWDLVLAPVVAFGPVLIGAVAGLDERFGWLPEVATWVSVVSLVVVAAAPLLTTWAMVTNHFFGPVVRIQSERGHRVVSGGPYRLVRHPGYLGAGLMYVALPLALGSVWAIVPTVVVLGALVLRTALEDRTLMEELPGYREYGERVRYRLVPGLW
ncbi:MAG: methyltransferase family protein [Anaerolineae bacterium]